MILLNKIKDIFFKKIFFYVVLIVIIWLGVIFVFCKINVGNPGLWYDESGQFWIGKGLNHYSLPFSPVGNLAQVLDNNAHFNLDPGGFSIIVHYWTMISNNHIFLKILPFVFFVISMIVITGLCLIWKPENLLAYFGGFVLLTSPLLSEYAFEFRPYSMEMLAVVLALYFCYKIPNILNSYRYALFSGTLLAILLSSRYSVLFSITSLGILVFGMLIFRFFKKKNIINFIVFVLPIIVSAILIYIFTLRYQNPTGLPPSYIKELMFKTASVSSILFNHQVFLTLLPFLILILIYLISFISNYLKKIIAPYRLYFFFTLILNLTFIMLSMLGKYPWGINSRWDISTHAIFTIAWLPLLFMATDFLYQKDYLIFKILRVTFIMFFILHYFNIVKDVKYYSPDSTYTNYISNNIQSDSKILINNGAWPTIRYLFEYGLLKGKGNSEVYKNISLFNHAEYILPNSITDLNKIKIDNYNYIILTFFAYDNSEIKDILSKKSNWIDCAVNGPSKMFKNLAKN